MSRGTLEHDQLDAIDAAIHPIDDLQARLSELHPDFVEMVVGPDSNLGACEIPGHR
jgi:hypothetical protein